MTVDIKNAQERDELHKSIWNIANDLKGAVDGWDFKQYVLGIMFYRYISEKIGKNQSGKYKISRLMVSEYARQNDINRNTFKNLAYTI